MPAPRPRPPSPPLGIDVNKRDEEGWTVLSLSGHIGNMGAVRELLAAGADDVGRTTHTSLRWRCGCWRWRSWG